MKKNLRLSALAILSVSMLSANADITDTNKRITNCPDFLSSQFTYDKTAQLVSDDYNDETGQMLFSIFDKNFDLIKKVETPEYPEVTAKYTLRRAINGPLGINISNVYENQSWEGLSREECEQMWQEEGYKKGTFNGIECFLPSSEWDYYYYEIYGYEYPQTYRVWLSDENKGIQYGVQYDATGWGPTGKYDEPELIEESVRPLPVEISLRSEYSNDIDAMYLSQTLFNTDDKYEWVIPMIETVACSYEDGEGKVEGDGLRVTGLKVMSEDGREVSTVTFPAGLSPYIGHGSDRLDLDLYCIDGKYFLIEDVYDVNSDDMFYIVYAVNNGSNSLQMVGEPVRANVHPTAPRRGTMVNVDLGEAATASHTVSVVSASGSTVYRTHVEPGQRRATINTDRLEKGVYVVTVSNGKTTHEHTKIVVR